MLLLINTHEKERIFQKNRPAGSDARRCAVVRPPALKTQLGKARQGFAATTLVLVSAAQAVCGTT